MVKSMLNFILTTVTVEHYLWLALAIFLIGLFSLGLHRNVISIMISVEVMVLAACLAFIAASTSLGQATGNIFALFILAVGAAEVALGLILFVLYFRESEDIEIANMNININD
jgi:NADH-quinone oxidoreductase subunit K